MIKANNRVAMYARFSSDNQRTESIDAQIRAMKQYCEQNHYVIVETYIDEAKSATTDRRPSFQRMIADSKKHLFDIVLVHKLDRFARNRYDSAVYKRELKKNGVTVYSVLENLDDSPESIMLQAVLEGMSEYYSENLGREVMKGMKETALQCKHTGGKPPLGFDVDPETKRLVINENEAESVRIIFRMFIAGYGYSAIIDELNRQDRRTKFGNRFNKVSFRSILENEKYKGVYVFNKLSGKAADGTRNSYLKKDVSERIIVEGGCPQIIDAATFDKAQEILLAQQRYRTFRSEKRVYLLAGRIFCKDCGKAMIGSSAIEYLNYSCKQRYLCTPKAIKLEYIEAYTVKLLESDIFNVKSLKAIHKALSNVYNSGMEQVQKKIEAIDRETADIDAQLANSTEAITKGVVSETLIEHINALEERKKELLSERNRYAVTSAINPDDIDVLDLLQTYKALKRGCKNGKYTREYREFIRDYIERIAVGAYDVTFIIKTGLGYFDWLDTEHTVERQIIYFHGRT